MTISELSSLFENAKASQPWAQNMSFEDFAAVGAQATGDPEMYRISQAGPIENTLRGWNQGLTAAVNSTPIDEFLGNRTADLGSYFGINRDTAYNVGASLPRQVVNLAPMLVPGPGWVATAGMLGSAGLSAADTYDQTGSTWQAGISAVAPTVVSKAMSAGGNAVLNAAAKSPAFQRVGVTGVTKLPGRFTDQTVGGAIARQGHRIEEDIVKGFANKAVRYAGGQAAGQAAGLALDVAAQGTEAVFNRDYLFANLVGNLAFAPLDAGDFIGTKVIASRDVFPDKAPDIRNAAEQRAFDFEKMIAGLDQAELAQAKKAAGLDVATQLIQERRLAGLEDKFDELRTAAKESFAAEWESLSQANPNLPELKAAITAPEAVSFELFPEANLKLNDYKEKLKSIDGQEKAAWSQAMMRPNLESLQSVAIDELRLPETLLNKPVEQRTLKDYQDALVDKVRDRGIKALYSIHKIASGQEVELQARGVAEEVKKLLAGQPTKFAEDRSFVAMALWATGGKPRAEKVVEAKVKQRVDEGDTVKTAIAKETKTDVRKVVKAKRGADKKKRKVNEKVTQRVETIEQEAMAAGQAVDAKKATPDQKVLVDAYRYASEQSGGDAASLRAMLSSLGKIWASGKSAEEKLKLFKGSVNTIKTNLENNAKESVGLPKETMTEADVQEARLEVDEDGEVVVEKILDEESAKEVEDATAIAHDRAVEKEMLRIVMDYKDVGIEQAREVLNTLSPKMTQALWKTAEENLKVKAARNSSDVVPQVGLQQLMTFDKWTDVLLADQGFDDREVTQLKEHFAKVVEIFYSPEVKYGFLDEFPLESKLAKGYVGVVGENGVRWRYGELNQMVHDDTPDTRPRLGETKFRYRDDTQTLYKWGHITEVEMENIKAKLAKLSKEVKYVKLISNSSVMSEAHGITTLFGPEPGQKVKWAQATPPVSIEKLTKATRANNLEEVRKNLPSALTVVRTKDLTDLNDDGTPMELYSIVAGDATQARQLFVSDVSRTDHIVAESPEKPSMASVYQLFGEGTLEGILNKKELQKIPVQEITLETKAGKVVTSESLFARKGIPGSTAYAAAVESRRQIFLNPKALEGLSPLDRVRVQASLLAHENSHILIDKARNGLFGPDAKAIVDNMDLWASSANPHEIEVVVDTMADVFLDKRTRDLPGVADVIKNLRDNSGRMDKDEVLANMYGIWATGLHQLKDPGRFYTFLPKVVRDAFDWISEKLQGVVRAAQMYVRFGGDQEKLGRVQQVRDVFAAVRKGARQAEENLGELNQLANLSQTDIFDLADAKFAKGVYGSTGKLGASVMNKVDSWIVRQGSLAATHKGLEKPFRAMVDTMPLIQDLIAQSYAGLGWGDYSYTGLVVKKNTGPARIRDSESLNKTMSKVNVELQKLMDTAVVKKPDGTVEFDIQKLSPELRGEVMSYNPEAQRIMAEYVIKRSEATMPIVHGTIVKAEWDKQTDNLHKILFRYESMQMDYKLAETVAYEAMQAVRQGDTVKLAEVLKKIPSSTEAEQIGKFVTAMGQRIQKLEADYKSNPAFGSLRRFQPIKQTWTKGSEVYNMQARNAKDAEAQSAKLEAEGWTPGAPRILDYKPTDEWVMDSNSKKRLLDMETRLHESLDNLGLPADVKEALKKDMNFVAMLEEDAAGKSVFSTQVKRNFAEGTDRLNVLEQDLTFINSAISGSLKRALDAKVSVAMLNPDLTNVKDARDVFQQGYENWKSSNNPWLGKLSKANAAWFIGLNLPGHVAELMQPVMTHLAEMRNIGLRTGQALSVLMSSTKDVTDFYKRNAKKFIKGETVHLWDDWANKEEREMLFELKHVINANPLNYAFDEIGFKQQQLVSMTEGSRKKSLAELAMSPATAYGNWSLKFYNLFTRHNAIMGLLGGYRAYRQAGFTHAEAKEKVRLYEVVVNKSGGRADRQAAPFKGNAVLGHLFYGLQGYTTGWFSQALTYARHGYNSKEYEGFKDNPTAAKNARAALHTMLGAQLAAAGIVGMPFVGAMMALAEDLFGEDIRGEMYENLETVTGDPLLAQAASHGIAAALADKLGIPADLHGRFAIGGFLGFNAYDGFSPASLLGPSASMINGMWKMGKTYADEHDLRKSLASGGPTGIRNIAKALDQELPASDDSPIATALGFRSTQARKEIEFERIAKLRNEKAAREISHAARRIQENLGRGSAVVQQLVMAEAKKLVSSDNPQELKQVISKIGSKVRQYEEEKRFPQDLREVGSSGQSAALANVARSMGVQLPKSQEVDRELMKSELYQMMGMPYRSRLKDALEQDLLTQQNPWAMR